MSGEDALQEALEQMIHAGIVRQWHGSMRDDVALTDPRPIVRDLLPVVLRYGREKAAEELETLAFRLVSQDVQDQAVYDEIGALRATLTAQDPT